MASGQWNLRNPAVKRIVQELKEIQRDDNPDIVAEALEDNIFEWHFVIRGAWDTEFEGGIYHGRILMPAEYPFKPPAFVMMTPSGRFETGTKICLSISSFHPESWQPSWSVRSALVALIAFMQTPGNGAVGSIDHTPEVRRQMAAEARVTPPKHANPERQELINSLHQRMLDMEDRSRSMSKQMPPADVPQAEEAQDLKSEEGLVQEDSCCSAQPLAEQSSAAAAEESPAEGRQIAAQAVVEATPVTSPAPVSPVAPQPRSPPLHVAAHTPPPLPSQQPAAQPPVPQEELFATPVAHPEPATPPQATSATPIGAYETPMAVGEHGGHVQSSWEDRGLTFLAVLLAALIAAMLLRRVILSLRPHEADGLFSVNPMGDIEL